MSSSSGVLITHSQLLPTQENLIELSEKLLTVFGVESILGGGRRLPSQPLQREFGDIPRYVLRPIVGNDFHVHTAFGCSPSWKALLQLGQDHDGLGKICLPLCDVAQHPKSEEDAPATELVQKMAMLLWFAWPDATVAGPSKRRQLGPPFVDPELPDYQLFEWLASKDLNPVGEGVFVTHLYESEHLLYQPLRQRARGLALKTSPEAEQTFIAVNRRPDAEIGQVVLSDDSAGQIWSFTGPDSWVISLPVVATILLLMTHPTKEVHPLPDNPDRDLSWTLDSLHGFCRKEGLEDGDRHLSWSLGTYPDRWMYLNFIFHYYTPHSSADEWIGSGIRCDRRNVTVPLGGCNGKKTFREQRVWFSMRTATTYEDGHQADEVELKGPATIGFVLADPFHHPIRMTKKVWSESPIEPVKGASGITAFQMLLWGGVNEWSSGWNACFDYIDRLYEVQFEDIDGSNPNKLRELMFDPQLAEEYFVAAHLLKIFRRQIDVLPRSLEQVRSKWERIYPGVDSDLLQRFDEPTQLTLLRNWSRLVDHANALHGKLSHRIEKTSSELLNLRDSLLNARRLI